ncbi:substrate-binding periplasmic protein [Spartinivicinus poritis]|uniref:Transporter substrate-binding domain-containing protein n=1 Tax=Spartinivicinus poritis TaxID=2994640 RepID=A0ABT5U932_9GAMM|nr:transporter substrate-binding domain-containing protein [Spartinivicinus sp. A2-2]MDE1462057.1 transporter substrate-binding domain-containing protein [Spartinivicinus sp. A2-2]
MKIFLAFFTLSAWILINSVSASARPLNIVGESFPPYEFEYEGRIVGIDIDIIKYIFDKFGVEYTVRLMPWKRAWHEVENARVDAILGASRKKVREPFVYYPQEDMWKSSYIFFSRGKMSQPVEIDYDTPLKNLKTIGVVRGYSYHDSFWQKYPNRNDGTLNPLLEEATDVQQSFLKLANGRIDFFIIDKTVGHFVVNDLKLRHKVTYSTKILFEKGYTMPFVKRSDYPNIRALSVAFNAELSQMKASGLYDEIINKWMNCEKVIDCI